MAMLSCILSVEKPAIQIIHTVILVIVSFGPVTIDQLPVGTYPYIT
jgi:hypothetical protein